MPSIAATSRFALLVSTLLLASPSVAVAQEESLMLTSPAFADGEHIPTRHTAYGENVSPALRWKGVPDGVRSFAIVLEDSSTPGPAPFAHWVLYNLPGNLRELPEGIPTTADVEQFGGARQGPNGVRRIGYFGPRPPGGDLHEYQFRLYALSNLPELPEGLDRSTLLELIRPHIIAEAVLTGSYEEPPSAYHDRAACYVTSPPDTAGEMPLTAGGPRIPAPERYRTSS